MSNIPITIRAYHAHLLQSTSYRIIQEVLTKTLYTYNVTIPEWKLLVLTTEKVAQRHADLAQIMDIERPLVTVLIDSLEKKRLVRRTRDMVDRRAKVIVATSQGIALIREIEPKVRLVMKQLLRGITTDEITIYMKVLTTIVNNGHSM